MGDTSTPHWISGSYKKGWSTRSLPLPSIHDPQSFTMLRQLRPRASLFQQPSRLIAAATVASQQSRLYSIQANAASDVKAQDIDPSKLTITKTTTPKELLPANELVFGRTFTDHMLSLEWTASTGWLPPRITPYQNLSLDPASCVFHYAFECFEGMKAYKDSAGRVRLFRPTKIGTQRTLGVGPPGSALLYVIASPVGPYYPTGFKAVSLEATDYAVRAWPGGVGDKKLGANYAPCILPQLEAAKRGFHQNLWLFGEEEYVTEVGTMNMFVAIKNKETGQKELLTAPLDGTILEGVTRDSVLSLAREKLAPEGWIITERKYTMPELSEAANEGRLLEAFGAGTAAIVSPVRNISWRGNLVDCGLKPEEEAGEIALRMKEWIEARQYGDEEHEWSYVVPK